jgi:sulfite reductase (NADPH) flavoprotein alpha-component
MPNISLPRTAPFAPEQIAALDLVMGDTSAVQRAWLAGFLAGLDAVDGKVAAPVAAPVPKQKLTVLYATESGNSEALAAQTKALAGKRGFAAKILDMADADLATLAAAGTVLAIVSTWGDGEPPQRAAPFFRALMAADAARLDGLKFAVLALGDSSYAQFCETGRQLDARFEALGATRAGERIELDLDYEAAAKTWLDETLARWAPAEPGAVIPPAEPGSVIHVDFQKTASAATKAAPFAAEVTAHGKLTSERASAETYHVEFGLAGSGITYEPGDALAIVPRNAPALVADIARLAGLPEGAHEALAARHDINTLTRKQMKDFAALTGDTALAALADDDAKAADYLRGRQWVDLLEDFPHGVEEKAFLALLRPLPPRYYSIASSQKLVGDEAHLTVARVAYESAGRARLGVASSMIADRLRAGERAEVFVKANPHFRLPTDAALPVIMIGAGTGVAPYRAFLQDIEAREAKTPTWLIFGFRNYLYDFLYQLEIQAWRKSGMLGRLDLAASRDQPEKHYVQHVLWAQRETLRAQLAAGAVLYLCGDATHMAKDVDATLVRILQEGDLHDGGGADGQARLDALISAGRYKKDVY